MQPLTTPPPDHGSRDSLIHKLYQYYVTLYKFTALFPKKDRFTLGVRIEKETLELFELILLARTKSGTSEALILNKADLKLKLIKLFVRLAYDVKVMPQQKYIDLEGRLVEIGKILGGWIKKTKLKGTPASGSSL